MKKNLLLIMLSAMLVSCGAGTSNVKTNDILGDLPKLYADQAVAKAEFDHKAEKMAEAAEKSGNYDDLSGLMELDKKLTEQEKTNKAEAIKQIAALVGKELPFKMTDALTAANVWYKVSGAPKLYAQYEDLLGLETAFINNAELSGDYRDYPVYAYFANSAGEPISTCDVVMPVRDVKQKPIAAGTALAAVKMGPIAIEYDPEPWGDFAQVVFCTGEEREVAGDAIYKYREAKKAQK